jgi:hypothetical protein
MREWIMIFDLFGQIRVTQKNLDEVYEKKIFNNGHK